ncbi:sensor histidine kinase [Roseburia sp. AM59-24XD]|jgi:signal transduction histidine kinase|uniref:sensor histidine kinase n=1 Tax=Roseburia sp. AM59-24XD TaxID=2293138 RepID=UPI000E4CB83C|nr:HAMP domain-containing sensor histidine kinase [Roseburia sp. AM59-24XD]RHP87023.1 sensor histidine kinase [Roseburia sp. AM59-24XD]
MDWMMWIVPVAAGAIVMALLWRNYRLHKNIEEFAGKVEQALDVISSGGEWKPEAQMEDSLWGRTETQLARAAHLFQRKSEESRRERVQIKGLISDISHQTRTPVSNIKLYIEFLGEEELSEDGRQFLKKLQTQVERLDFLMQSMVKMSRLETGILQIQKEPGDICETLRRAVAAVVPDAAVKQIDLFMESSGEVMIDHDGRWTQEAVFNILDNAVKYTESGGEIHVALTRQEIFLKISISDTGKGIVPERQAEIFTRFYREPEVHDKPGVGIGLYLARRIMELQKGYIEVESEPGEGAEFHLYLPWRDAQDKV